MSDAPKGFAVRYQGREVVTLPNETVLDAILRASIPTPFSCKGGSCHTCILQCVGGEIPERAQRHLGADLRAKGYFLPCRCIAISDMSVRTPQPQDMVVSCTLVEVQGHETGLLRIHFESHRFKYRPGQIVGLVTGEEHEPRALLVGDPARPIVEAHWSPKEGEAIPAFLAPGSEYGTEFEVRGPYNGNHDEVPEMPMPEPDPELWGLLGGGAKVREVLECFYAKVYADPLLSPFFASVTRDFIIGKQYSFLETLITGVYTFFGDTPRNTHHWMVIPHHVFDHRQKLMDQALEEAGVPHDLAARWNGFEEHFRQDIVKDREWPRRINGELVDLQGFERQVMGVGTICDSCHAEVPAGAMVSYHKRTGLISCPQCMPEGMAA